MESIAYHCNKLGLTTGDLPSEDIRREQELRSEFVRLSIQFYGRPHKVLMENKVRQLVNRDGWAMSRFRFP